MIFVVGGIENIMGKGENTGYSLYTVFGMERDWRGRACLLLYSKWFIIVNLNRKVNAYIVGKWPLLQ